MSKKGKQKTEKSKKNAAEAQESLTKPWISMRTGLIIVAIASVSMAVLTAVQAQAAQKSLVESILWGILYGGLIWAIFFGNILVNRFLRRKR